MAKELIPYCECVAARVLDCDAEMHFGLGGRIPVLLMSVQPRAPYRTVLRRRHDAHLRKVTTKLKCGCPIRKAVTNLYVPPMARPPRTPSFTGGTSLSTGTTASGTGEIYENAAQGFGCIGLFHLVDSWQESDGKRQVCNSKLLGGGWGGR